MNRETLRESATLTPDPESGKGIWRVCLIEADVQGSSGYYPAGVLKRDGTEEIERPERSVRDLAGYMLDDATFEEGADGRGLFTRVQFTENAKSLVNQLAKVVGLSIRAAGQIEETPSGRIVRQISEGLSVDLVTRAGAGGRLVTMTESATPESPPAAQTAAASVQESATTHIPSTLGSGDLRNEVAALKESVGDRLDSFSVDVARLTQQLKEAQSAAATQARENQKLAEAISYLRDRAEIADKALKESKNTGDVLTELLEAKLPLPSMIRLAQSYRPEQDLHESITHEREYLKKLMRETERGALENRETSNLGLTESASSFSSSSSGSDSDMAEIRSLLSGGTY
jgi:hypothetical protein